MVEELYSIVLGKAAFGLSFTPLTACLFFCFCFLFCVVVAWFLVCCFVVVLGYFLGYDKFPLLGLKFN